MSKQNEPDPLDCKREWGVCEEEAGKAWPHVCMWSKGHGHDHSCGTCEASLPLDDNETSSLEEPYRG